MGEPTVGDGPQGPGWWQATDGRWYPPMLISPRAMSWSRLQAAPGWYPDTEPGWYRWWDGSRWTGRRRASDGRWARPDPMEPPAVNRDSDSDPGSDRGSGRGQAIELDLAGRSDRDGRRLGPGLRIAAGIAVGTLGVLIMTRSSLPVIAAGEEVALAETERSPGRSTGSSDGATAIGDRVETGPSGTGSDPPGDDPIPTGTDLVVVDGAAADPADPSGGEATGPDQRSDDDGSTPTPTPLGLGSTAVTTAGQGPSAATRTAEPESQATTGVSELDVVTPQAAAIEEPGPSPRSSTTTSSPPASTEAPSSAGSTATTSTSGSSSAPSSSPSTSTASSSEGSSFDDPSSSEADAGPVDGCHPAYVSCLPRLSGDALDCADLTADQRPVTLRSPAVDPYRLDGDGDGVGCRSG